MLSKVDINLLIKLTRFNFVSHRGSIKSMTKNTVNTINDLFVGIWARGEVFKYLWAIFFLHLTIIWALIIWVPIPVYWYQNASGYVTGCVLYFIISDIIKGLELVILITIFQ